MKLSKRILRHPLTQSLACWIGAQYIRFVFYTTRWNREGFGRMRQMRRRNKPFIMAFWHGRLLMMPYAWRSPIPFRMLISAHADGRLISKTVGHMGIDTIKGSTKKGGAAAFKAMASTLKSNGYVGITPDGPKGPYMQVSPGVIQLARLTGVPIFPATYAVKRRKVINSWDRFILAWPFNKGTIIWGKPVTVQKGDDISRKQRELEKEMVAITQKADKLCGQITP